MGNNQFLLDQNSSCGSFLYGQGVRYAGDKIVAFGKNYLQALETLLDQGLVHVPTYGIARGKGFDSRHQGKRLWSEKVISLRAERNVLFDESGILGTAGAMYVVNIEGGGLFVGNVQRIGDAIADDSLTSFGLKLNQDEVNVFLDAVKNKDKSTLGGLINNPMVRFVGDYEGFLEASANPNFAHDMRTAYIVIRPLEDVLAVEPSNIYYDRIQQNPDFLITAAGESGLRAMVDQSKKNRVIHFSAPSTLKTPNLARQVIIDHSLHSNYRLTTGIHPDNATMVAVPSKILRAFYERRR